ncbi:TolC family protein [Clostridium sp. BL-8]|uniref:TolC family protein n=1 Tax=Clostridium sp. BL-8 TaxID=349938 RepID=UPI00098C93F3|nr:TolC family protein [Clostridium sp. BL-8]OOM72962.1 outer membrane efflux protein [Clostridium sp. BL-8]
MRKNINKIIAFAIGVSVMSGSIIPVFAADSTTNASTTTTTASNAASTTTANSNVLTLDDAIKSTISMSNTLALDEQNIAYQDKENDITKKSDDFNDVNDDKEKYDDNTADTKLDQLKQQRDFDEDSLTQKVTDQYNSIVTQQMQIDMATKNLAVENKKLQDAKLKQSLGIQTSIDVQTSELQIQKDQNSLTTAQNKLKDAEYSFKVLTGKDVTQYTLDKDIKFEPFKIDGDVDTYLDNVIESQLSYKEELLKISKDYYNDKDYESDNGLTTDDLDTAETAAKDAVKPTLADGATLEEYEQYQNDLAKYNGAISNYTGILSKRLTYLTTKLGNYQSDVTITNTKKQLKDQLRSYYTNLQTYEASVNYCKNEVQLYNEQLSNAKLKYDLGIMTESDYNAQVVSTLQAQIDLRNAIVAYNQNKQYIQKPWSAAYSSSLY